MLWRDSVAPCAVARLSPLLGGPASNPSPPFSFFLLFHPLPGSGRCHFFASRSGETPRQGTTTRAAPGGTTTRASTGPLPSGLRPIAAERGRKGAARATGPAACGVRGGRRSLARRRPGLASRGGRRSLAYRERGPGLVRHGGRRSLAPPPAAARSCHPYFLPSPEICHHHRPPHCQSRIH